MIIKLFYFKVRLKYCIMNSLEAMYVSTCLFISFIVRGGVCTDKKTWTNTVERQIKSLLFLNGQLVM